MAVTKNDLNDTLTLADAKSYIQALRNDVIATIENKDFSGSAKEYAEDIFLSTDDIVDAIEQRNIKLVGCDIEEIKEMRSDALYDLLSDIEEKQ